MRYGNSAILFCSLTIGALGTTSVTEGAAVTTEYQQKIFSETTIKIDGKAEPDRVPRAIRMKLFFYRYQIGESGGYQVELAKQLSPADQRVLGDYTQRHQEFIQSDELEFSNAADVITANSGGRGAMEIATQYDNLIQRREANALARYEAVLSQLSPDGRAVVERFAYERVRPKVSISSPGAVARVAPHVFLDEVAKRKDELAHPKRYERASSEGQGPSQRTLSGSGELFVPTTPPLP